MSMLRALHSPSVSAPSELSVCGLEFASRHCLPLVAVLQTSHPRLRYHPSAWRGPWRDHPGLRRILLQAQLTTVVVIIGCEFTHHAVKMRWVEHDDFVQ